MLTPIRLYYNQVNILLAESWYDSENKYYATGPTTYLLEESKNNENHEYASVDKNNNVLGYICFYIDWQCRRVTNVSIISFDKGNTIFIQDLIQAIDDCFNKFNLNSICFRCYVDNPALRGYSKLITRCGGHKVGYLHDEVLLNDGKFHDTVIFEILKLNYKGFYHAKNNNISNKYSTISYMQLYKELDDLKKRNLKLRAKCDSLICGCNATDECDKTEPNESLQCHIDPMHIQQTSLNPINRIDAFSGILNHSSELTEDELNSLTNDPCKIKIDWNKI